MLPPSIDYARCYPAVARLGAVALGLNTRLGPREVSAIFNRATPALVVVDALPVTQMMNVDKAALRHRVSR